MNHPTLIIIFCLFLSSGFAQDYGNLPTLTKRQQLRDLKILYQALDQYHSGMYWYTPKDSFDLAFEAVQSATDSTIDVLAFYNRIAPLVGLTREDHTDLYLSDEVADIITQEGTFLPLTIAFLGTKMYCVKNGSDQDLELEGKEIVSINGETPIDIVQKIGELFASDGYIRTVKYSDLEGFGFAKYYYYHYGKQESFKVKLKSQDPPIDLVPLSIDSIQSNLGRRYPSVEKKKGKITLEFEVLQDSIGYLGVHTFSNARMRSNKGKQKFKNFLKKTFKTIRKKDISQLVIDVSQNGGGNEGNEGLLYAYLGENYQKYEKVRAKAQKVILDNGVDPPQTLKTFGFFEKNFFNRKMEDGSYERKPRPGYGLKAYDKAPKHQFSGELFVIISPVTYSGASEFASMVHTNELATFVGQETGGGYFGNTSGYGKEVTLPNSGITIDVPALQFVMNVNGDIPFGRGVLPDHEVIPTYEQYANGENAALTYILDLIEEEETENSQPTIALPQETENNH